MKLIKLLELTSIEMATTANSIYKTQNDYNSLKFIDNVLKLDVEVSESHHNTSSLFYL